jgi:FXSXX-COOH protein
VDDRPGEVMSALVDLTEVDLDEPLEDDPVLRTVVRMLKDELAHPDEAVAGFTSSL